MRAARYCSSGKPSTHLVGTSSIRRMPTAIASPAREGGIQCGRIEFGPLGPKLQNLFRGRSGFRHGTVEKSLAALRIGIDEVNRAVDHLVGADGRPREQVGGAFDVEPGAVRAGGAEMEAFIGQHGGWWARAEIGRASCRG